MRTSKLLLASLVFIAACKPAEQMMQPPPGPELQKPAAPSMLAATPGAGFVRLVWRDESDVEEGFIIGRVALASPTATFTAAELTELTRVSTDVVLFRDTPMLAQTWGYGVAAFNAAGTSDFVLLSQGVSAFGTTGSGCQVAVPSVEDVDGDGLSNEAELAGWTVHLNLNGQMQFSDVAVTSSPTLADGDDDGLCDAEELILRTNPTLADTDGDGLTDDDEVLIWGSSPINVDSDGDSTGNTAFFDGSELTRFGTSPTLADTDGDGRTDFEEINQNSTNALVADLPQPKLQLVGTVDVTVNTQLTTGAMTTTSTTTSLTRGQEMSTDRTNGVASSTTSEMSIEASLSVSAGFPDGVSATASASYGQSETRMSETSTSFEQSTTSTARQAYEAATSREATRNEVITDGKLAVQFNITNAGSRTFELRDLVVTAMTRDPNDPSKQISIATLEMPAAAQMVTLGDAQSAGPFRVEATVPANVALDLLSNPSGLVFKPASFQLVDRTGTNFAFTVGETTANRTATIVIDYGGDRALETYRVATNVARLDGGQLVGLKMSDALKAVGLMQGTGWEAQSSPRGVHKLTSVRGVAAQQRSSGGGTSKFWAVIASDNTSSRVPAATRLLDPMKNFEDVIIMPRDKIFLAYVSDEDGDGIFSREERLYRTSDTSTDTDGDGINDRDEIRVGWNVFSTLPVYSNRPHVYSDPTRADADGDTLTDLQERMKGTDPNRSDTDGDGVRDDADADPLKGITRPLLAAYGTLGGTTPMDIVVDEAGRMVVLGSGGVDVDDDGVLSNSFNRQVFIAGFDAQGRKRWAHELELLDSTTVMSSLVKGANGHVYFYENLYAGAFPGVAGGYQLVELDENGMVVSSVAVSGGGGGFKPTLLRRTSSGDFVTMGNAPFNQGFPLRVLVFSATGATVGFKEFAPPRFFSDPPLPRTDQIAVSNAGIILTLRGCELQVYERTLVSAPTVRNVCGDFADAQALVFGDGGDLYVSKANRTIHYSSIGVQLWNNVSTGVDFVNSMIVDRVGRVFRSTQTAVMSGPSSFGVRVIDAAGNETANSTLPSPVFAGPADVDSNGNYFLLGQMYDGLGGRLPQLGAADLVMMRNPQLIFP
ncbi:MAG: hypothetical protein QM817_33170 [Archangium sp.]